MFTRSIRSFGLVAGISLVACAAARGESAYVVRTTGINKEVSCQVMTREELAQLKQQVQAEARIFPTAAANVEKAWKADETNKGKPFPSSQIGPRKVQEAGPLDIKVAQKKAEDFEERAMDFGKDDSKSKKKLSAQEKEREKERAAREAERNAAATRAAELVEAEVQRLMSGAAKPGAAAPAAPATPAAPAGH